MRLPCLPLLLLAFATSGFAQSTNFSSGPQYLVTSDNNPMFLRSIATPSLNLGGQTLAGTTDVQVPVVLPALAPTETVVYLHDVYWGEHSPDQSFVPQLAPPTMTADQTAWYMNYVANQPTAGSEALNPEPGESAPLSGSTGQSSVIELSGGTVPANLPASLWWQLGALRAQTAGR